MRNTFINAITSLAEKHEDIFLLCGDLGFSVLEPFAARFPDRFLNVGIAEQNMTGVATGLSREGYNVFTYSIGNFPTLRCMEQIRYDVCYHEANVKIVAVGGGYAYGPQGVSHHTTEDIAMLRSIPNMTVCVPADKVQAKSAANYMVNHQGPGYVRLNKSGEPLVHDPSKELTIKPGQAIPIKTGEDTLVLALGALVYPILKELIGNKAHWALWSTPFVGSYDHDLLIAMATDYSRIVTIEEHQLNGGFGSSIVESFSDLYEKGLIPSMPKIKRIGIRNTFICNAGTQEFLRELAGINLSELIP